MERDFLPWTVMTGQGQWF